MMSKPSHRIDVVSHALPWSTRRIALAVVVAGMVLASAVRPTPARDAGSDEPAQLDLLVQSLAWREVGPYRGGRSAAVCGIPSQPDVYYFGATGGGVWKTLDGGRSWTNRSDGTFGGSIGAVAVSEWDPNVVYVGGGEKTVRGNVSHGDGVWKSTDAGRTWKNVGLTDSRHVCRIRIHPRDPDVVYAAALGHLFGPNEQRGVFRSVDGGGRWERVLFVNPDAGAVDLEMDPTNPRILYATTWRVRRTPYSLESGGEGSGLWKTVDGGSTWTEISRNEGLPRGTLGISGISVSRSNPDNVYAIVEAEEGGVFRSRDAGKTWSRVNQDRSLRQRAWYYTRIYADPSDEESVYVLNVQFHHSKDGGRSFTTIPTPHSDNHDLWIDPGNPLRMIEANDGGANVSLDGGKSWTPQDNQPTAQMYRVSTDNDFPYRLLGGQQDNSALRIRSRSLTGGGISSRDWDPTAGGESGHVVAKPDEPDRVYGGSYGGDLGLVHHRTGERRALDVWPDNPMGWGAAELRYRFQWNYPIFFSPHDPNVLYCAANVLFRSKNGGQSWDVISPDLTRDDKTKQKASGGPITKDNTSVEYYCTIFAAAESPLEKGVLWAGSDDGLIHVSRDDGTSWTNVTPPSELLPEWAQINSIDVHPHDEGGLYVAATRYKLDDFRPYVLRTLDYGKSWTAITDGIPTDHFTRVVRADPERKGLLYAGTERGMYFSRDDGAHWESLQLELPQVPITDLAVKEGDLVVATQGRGYWILDDRTVLHQIGDGEAFAGVPALLLTPRPTDRVPVRRSRNAGRANQGTNPPGGVVFHYWLAEEPKKDAEVRLTILDPNGEEIKTFTRLPGGDGGEGDDGDDDGDGDGGGGSSRRGERSLTENLALLPVKAGMNRFVWDMRYPAAERFPRMVLWNGRLQGPMAVPGRYRARLVAGDWSGSVDFEIRPDPRSSATPEDLRLQLDFLIAGRDKLTETHRAIGKIREVRSQLGDLRSRLTGDAADVTALRDEVKGVLEAMEAVEKTLYQTQNQSRQDPLNFPIRLNDKLAGVLGVASTGDFRPTDGAVAVQRELFSAIDAELARLRTIWSDDIPAINHKVSEIGVRAIDVDDAAGEGGDSTSGSGG